MCLLSPIAGVFADRWNRRTAMIVSDFGAGLAVLAAGGLYLTHHLQIWMVIPINLWMASFNTLMWPSFTASVTLLVPKQHYGRANGFVQLGEALPQIAGPALAGALYVAIHLGNMALIDFATYAFSVLLMLIFVRIPNPPRTTQGQEAKGSLWKEMRFGWDYITARKGLLALLLFFLATNFLSGVMSPLLVPLILDNWDASTLGYISTLMGVGMLAGTLVMSAWGGGKRKIFTLLGSAILTGIFLTAVGLRASPPTSHCLWDCHHVLRSLHECLQPGHLAGQGRPGCPGACVRCASHDCLVFRYHCSAAGRALGGLHFKPSMAVGGALAPILGPIFGYGASRGIGVLISLAGLLTTGVAIIAMVIPLVRRVELDLPDHETVVKN